MTKKWCRSRELNVLSCPSKHNQYHFKENNKRNEPQWAEDLFFIPTFLMFFLNVSFFKHCTPQLTHNCCPRHMNYAAFDVNSDSLALNKSKGISEPDVITKVILED